MLIHEVDVVSTFLSLVFIFSFTNLCMSCHQLDLFILDRLKEVLF